MQNFIEMLFRFKNVKILLNLHKRSACVKNIAKNIDCEYVFVFKTLQKFEKLGLVVSKKVGRKRMFSITPVGKNIAINILNVSQMDI
jgi:predicted transcriptional regulator